MRLLVAEGCHPINGAWLGRIWHRYNTADTEQRRRLALKKALAELPADATPEQRQQTWDRVMTAPQRHAASAFDVTVSPVKSVSLLWAFGDDHTRQTVLAAHHAGVRAVVVVSAKVRSKEPDALSAWLSLDSHAFYKASTTARIVYERALEAHLVQHLGCGSGPGLARRSARSSASRHLCQPPCGPGRASPGSDGDPPPRRLQGDDGGLHAGVLRQDPGSAPPAWEQLGRVSGLLLYFAAVRVRKRRFGWTRNRL
jgi:hypothetical protein